MSSNAVGCFNAVEGKIKCQPYDNSMPTQALSKEDWWKGSRRWNNPAVTFFLKVKLTYIQDHKPVAWVTRIKYSSHMFDALCLKKCRLGWQLNQHQVHPCSYCKALKKFGDCNPREHTVTVHGNPIPPPSRNMWGATLGYMAKLRSCRWRGTGPPYFFRWADISFGGSPLAESCLFFDFWILLVALLETNISPFKGTFEDNFLFPRWDMLVPWRVLLDTFDAFEIGENNFLLQFPVTVCLIETYIIEVEYGSHGMLGLWKSQNLHIKSHDVTDHWWSTGWTLEANDAWYQCCIHEELEEQAKLLNNMVHKTHTYIKLSGDVCSGA